MRLSPTILSITENEESYGLYAIGKCYWIASPTDTDPRREVFVYRNIDTDWCTSKFTFRPIVSIPMSAVTVSGDTVTINMSK